MQSFCIFRPIERCNAAFVCQAGFRLFQTVSDRGSSVKTCFVGLNNDNSLITIHIEWIGCGSEREAAWKIDRKSVEFVEEHVKIAKTANEKPNIWFRI